MRVRILLLLVVSVALLGFAPAPLPRKERQRQDLTDVSGTWVIVVWEDRAMERQGSREMYRLELTKRTAAIILNGDRYREDYVMRLDPAASPPAFTWSRGQAVTFVGSYRLEKDQMTVIFNRADRLEQRPTDFAGMADFRFTMRRTRRP
jgi:uncharacterized protein (TIGR03067 family)